MVVLGLCAFRVVLAQQSKTPWADGLSLFCHGSLLGLAYAAVGGLIGFLFGIPRTETGTSQQSSSTSDDSHTTNTTARPPATQSTNTNLEQVSDWLTKIILGAGLTQLIKVPDKIKAIGSYYQADFGGSHLLPELLALHSVVLGFFIGYLITRLFLASAFVIADRGLSASAEISRALRISDAQSDKQNYGDAAATLETAIGSIGPNTPRETKLLYYERLTYTALYEPPPIGFQKAIQYIDRFIEQEQQPLSARLYVNLACAYGQQYDWEKKHENRESILKESRDKALDAVRKALQADPGTKSILRQVWDPSASTIREEENDLESFREDPEFRALLGN
jgi:hypothetical protein